MGGIEKARLTVSAGKIPLIPFTPIGIETFLELGLGGVGGGGNVVEILAKDPSSLFSSILNRKTFCSLHKALEIKPRRISVAKMMFTQVEKVFMDTFNFSFSFMVD